MLKHLAPPFSLNRYKRHMYIAKFRFSANRISCHSPRDHECEPSLVKWCGPKIWTAGKLRKATRDISAVLIDRLYVQVMTR